MARNPQEPIGRISRRERKRRTEQTQQERPRQQERTQQRPQARAPQSRQEVRAGDRFRANTALDRFAHKIARRADQGVGFYQTIRLPGRTRVIHDRRVGRPGGDGHEPMEEKSTTPTRHPKRSATGRLRPNYFGDRTSLANATSETVVAEEQRPLSDFEQAMVERFEAATEQIKRLAAGEMHFFTKSAQEWMQFFSKFLHRTAKRQTQLSKLQQQMLRFRGLLRAKGSATKGWMIGDLHFARGNIEKFARFEVELAQIMAELQGTEPGEMLGRELVARGLAGESLQFFTIGPGKESPMQGFVEREAGGIFTTRRTEEAVAQRLGLRGHRSVDPEGRRRGGVLGEEDLVYEEQSRFVPWWQREPGGGGWLKSWFVPVTLLTLIVATALALVMLF